MARYPKPRDIAESRWREQQVECPICNKPFNSWYCPDCGIPKNNSKYISYEKEIFCFYQNHFKDAINIEEYQLCYKCYTPNPYNANYCRSCGENLATQARDKNGHGWVDLGLSVLWSTESLPNRFLWNDNTTIFDNHDGEERLRIRNLYIKSNRGESDGKDTATSHLGKKWRTPTKKEYEELITKCKWEKYIIPSTNQFALKGIGPNGNSIIFPINTGYESTYGFNLWSSTQEDNKSAYCFGFSVKLEFEHTLTDKQKKIREFIQSNNIRFKVDYSTDELLISLYSKDPLFSLKLMEEKRRRAFPQYEKILEQQKQILDAMGDDSQEIEYNEKSDLKRLHNLWLTTPIKIATSSNRDIDFNGAIRIIPRRKTADFGVWPVADKKMAR